jgi:hypothetical protein
MSGPLLLFVGALLVPVCLLVVRRAMHVRNEVVHAPSLLLAGIGVSLILTSVGLGIVEHRVHRPPSEEAEGVGVVLPVTPRLGRGTVTTLGVEFHSCGKPVSVTAVVDGTAEFWIDWARTLKGVQKVTVAVPDLRMSNVRAGFGQAGDVAVTEPFTQRPVPGRLMTVEEPRRLTSVTAIPMSVRDWGTYLRPLVVRFDAHWLYPRSLGSCYLRLPALAAASTVLSAQEAAGRLNPKRSVSKIVSGGIVYSVNTGLSAPYNPALEGALGLTSLRIGKSALRTDLSQPAPDRDVSGRPTWTCKTTPRRTDSPGVVGTSIPIGKVPDSVVAVSGDSSAALSASRISAEVAQRDCAAIAVIEESNAELRRDLLLLLVGALFSLGITLLVELGLNRIRSPEE